MTASPAQPPQAGTPPQSGTPAQAATAPQTAQASATAPAFSPIGIGAVAAATLAGRNVQVAKTERKLPPLLRSAEDWPKD